MTMKMSPKKMGTKKMCEADYGHIVPVLSGIGGDANVSTIARAGTGGV